MPPQRLLTLALPLLAACSDGYDQGSGSDAGSHRDAAPRDVTLVTYDADPAVDDTVVYAHSDTVLYAVDPHNNAVRTVGAFTFAPGDSNRHTMTDLAVDALGNLVGNTANALYRVSSLDASCTLLAPLPGSHVFVGLTYVPVGMLDPGAEALVGGATDGTFWRIDPATGDATQLGQFDGGWGLSGDLVSINGAATYATVRQGSSTRATDSLAIVDVRTGQLTVVGDTGFSSIYGLGYWRSTLYGFTRSGLFITIDVGTGQGHMVSMPATQFSGAGVTTLSPVTPP